MKRIIFAISLLLIIQPVVSADIFQYVAKEDPSFKWEKLGQQVLPSGASRFDLELISQTWKDILWNHRLTIVAPKEVKSPTMVFLIITGSWNEKDDDEMAIGSTIVSGTGAPVAVLYDVPRQPLFDGLYEDSLIAYTFTKVLETGDDEWALLFPMTKTAVRAMDAIQGFFKKEFNIKVSGFVVAGGSKRGWTTWFSASVDKRVKGIAPMVYDNLNLVEQMERHLMTWGTYSEQIDDYTKLNIPQQVRTEKGQKLAALVDPYTYRDRITMPKLIVVGTNDRYWPLDAMNLYYDDLVGEKYILRVPNKGHGVDDMTRVLGDAVAFFLKVDGKLKFPELSWNFKESKEGLELSISSDLKPSSVSVWIAEAPTRDFRDVVWQESKITSEDSKYIYNLKRPGEGYSAIFGEAVYQIEGKQFFLSTGVCIITPEQ